MCISDRLFSCLYSVRGMDVLPDWARAMKGVENLSTLYKVAWMFKGNAGIWRGVAESAESVKCVKSAGILWKRVRISMVFERFCELLKGALRKCALAVSRQRFW